MQLHSDQGKQFESEEISVICKLLGINKTHTTPYQPQSNGLVERVNRTLLSILATAALEHPFDWEQQLVQCTTPLYGLQLKHPLDNWIFPFFLLYGRKMQMPLELMYEQTPAKLRHPSQ